MALTMQKILPLHLLLQSSEVPPSNLGPFLPSPNNLTATLASVEDRDEKNPRSRNGA